MNQTITMFPETTYNQMDKRILVKFAGGMRQSQEVVIGPGTTTSDLLKHLGLDSRNFLISMGTPNSIFGNNENIYSRVQDGDQLFISSKVDAGK